MITIDSNIWDNGMDYQAYKTLINNCIAANRTTGPNQGESLIEYTRLNGQRMTRIEKTIRLDSAVLAIVKTIQQPMNWLVITEAWCGDAAQIIPVIAALADQNAKISLRLVLRDENPALIQDFLTNGSASIPKILVIAPETNQVLGHWGPRPVFAQALMLKSKLDMAATTDPQEKATIAEAAKITLHSWYARDKTIAIQREFSRYIAEDLAVK